MLCAIGKNSYGSRQNPSQHRNSSTVCLKSLHVIHRVTIFVGEDAQRSLSERVVNFIPRICKNYTVIDTKDYELKGISPKFRSHISHLVMHAVNNRIDAHMEEETCHPMEIRRYYRKLNY